MKVGLCFFLSGDIVLRILILLQVFLTFPLFAESAYKAANAPGAIGETGSLFLIEDGIFARPFYNDVYGKTDKQLTGALQLGFLKSWRDSSLESRIHWLAITPTFKESQGTEYLKAPVGRYSDWIELQESWMKFFQLGDETLRFQVSLGVGHIGNHGAKRMHRRLHELIGSSLHGLDYDNQPAGWNWSGGLELGLIDDIRTLWGLQKESMLNVGVFQNKFMTDLYISQNHVFSFSEKAKAGLEMRLVRQAESDIYGDDDRLSWRFELAAGFRYKWYRPSIKYVSPFLRGDQMGQTYLDPLAVYFEW